MRKTVFLTASVIVFSAVTPLYANAMTDEEALQYQPTAYFKCEKNDFIEVLSDGTVYIDKSNITDDIVLSMSSYYQDESLMTGRVMLRAAGSDVDCIKLSNVVNPVDIGEIQAYDQSPASFVFESAEKDILISANCNNGMNSYKTRLIPYGEHTDDYPFALFDAVVSADIPIGEYDIHYILQKDIDTSQGSMYCQATFAYDDVTISGGKYDFVTYDQKIIVSDRTFGDVSGDGFVDSVDASLVLSEYSNLSTEKGSTFTNGMKYSADLNNDGYIDSVDASNMLSYYAYASVAGNDNVKKLSEFLSSETE